MAKIVPIRTANVENRFYLYSYEEEKQFCIPAGDFQLEIGNFRYTRNLSKTRTKTNSEKKAESAERAN